MKALLNRLLYPKTDAGRRRYVKDGMNHCKPISAILIILGITGLIICLILCFKGIDFRGLWLIVLLSMVIFAAGVQGIEGRDK